jgi:hypothetical protein
LSAFFGQSHSPELVANRTVTSSRAADVDSEDCSARSRHDDGVTTQSMNCHTATVRVVSNSAVAIAWATK